ncbi:MULTISPECIES: methylenetetrahydrofolate reductase [Pseudothermotoga]|jgi:methylenetetrahydrofolate reductase (NADPH)|nr:MULTISPECIES: methylenetetrahydrofolate reductase [Pseudothermotoga]MDI3495801.1 methylenetetrahydrofolate reductase [Pseudothermotoga sp.]GLI49144.1 methylenetetrahydrofolate reductase [Pseudothermotoga lettingae TMO]HBT25290.1 5,10-methylenetetrahydrofolate reductase [Pseudothermotoga sp.]
MKVIDCVKKGQILSIEILPPNRGQNIEEIYAVLDELMNFPISFINVTKHAPEMTYLELEDGIVKVPKVKRPGTVGMTAALMNRYNIDVVPHVLCFGMNKYQIEDMLIDLHLIGVRNLFVIRGEYENQTIEEKDSYSHASDLVKQISNMNMGEYLYPCENAKPTDFCIGVAGYPEKHFEAPNIEEDMRYLKKKIESGADYVITQMIFDFDVYKKFVERARQLSINVPIIPGVKPVVSLKSIYTIPRKFFVNIPESFVKQMQEAKTHREEFQIGTKYMAKLVEKLLSSGAPGVHVFTMGKGQSTKALLEAVFNR